MKKILFLLAVGVCVFVLFIFQKNNSEKEITTPIPKNQQENQTSQDEAEITMVTTGDIGLVRDVNNRIIQKKDANYPFLNIAEYTRNADLTITNLEGPLIENCPIVLTGFQFCGESTNVKGLVYAGIDAASLANNHTTNYGIDGLNQTIEVLKIEGILPFGVGDRIEYLNVKNKKFAFVGFVELGNNWGGLNNATMDNVSRLVSEADKNADIVITAFHWGAEYTHQPTTEMKEIAHLAIDTGADIVLGNHPHWIQINEIYRGKFVTYAQGNTIFDQDWSQETKEGVIYKFVYKGGKFEKIDEKYTIIEDNSQPRFATDEEAARIKAKIK